MGWGPSTGDPDMQRTNFYTLLCPLAAFFLLASCSRVLQNGSSQEASPSSVTVACTASSTVEEDLPKPEDLNGKFSYTYGYLLFQALANQGFEKLDARYFARGAVDAKSGNSFFSQVEMEETLRTVQQILFSQAKREYETLASDNERQADSFFAENGGKEGVETMEGGIQFKVITQGELQKPAIGIHDTVSIDYTITMLDGRFLIGTSERGHSEVFTVDALPSGFLKDGIQLLHPGAHYRFWVPYTLVEESGYLPQLEPNAAVVVDLEIREVKYAGEAG